MKSIFTGLRSIRRKLLGLDAYQARLDVIHNKIDVLTASMMSGEATVDSAAEKYLDRQSLEPGESVRVVFVAQHPSIWPSWRSVWQAMDKDPRFVVKIVLSPFIHPFSSTAVTLDEMRACFIDANVPFCTVDYFNIDTYRPHLMFLQNPYDETRPEHLRSERLAEKGIRVAYIPYGLEVGGGAWNITAQFDSALHRTAWKIFARSERHKKMYGKYCHAGNSHVVVTGHPKFDAVNAKSELPPSNEIAGKIGGRKVILWTPHFSVSDVPAWSTYRRYSEYIFSEFTQRQDLFLLLRPHPLFFKAMLQHGVWDAEGERKFRQAIKESSNVELDESPDYHAAFSVSDALMTDVGSFLLEYLPTGKPLLYLNLPDGLGMNDDGELVNFLYKASTSDDIKYFIEMVFNGQDPKKSEREAIVPEFLSGLDVNVGEKIAQSIYSSITAGDTWFPRLNKQRASLQNDSETYWKNSTNTYLAPSDYYEAKEAILQQFLLRLPPIEKAIDIGCGDGKFTFQLAKFAKEILAYDISSALIDKAREAASTCGATNVTFSVQELEAIAPFAKYDLVACMGVTSCIIDDIKFVFFLDKLRSLCRQGAYLLLIDTLSTANEQNAKDQNGYVAKYRVIDDYRRLFERRGFALREEILIKESIERQWVNKLFVLQFCN